MESVWKATVSLLISLLGRITAAVLNTLVATAAAVATTCDFWLASWYSELRYQAVLELTHSTDDWYWFYCQSKCKRHTCIQPYLCHILVSLQLGTVFRTSYQPACLASCEFATKS